MFFDLIMSGEEEFEKPDLPISETNTGLERDAFNVDTLKWLNPVKAVFIRHNNTLLQFVEHPEIWGTPH